MFTSTPDSIRRDSRLRRLPLAGKIAAAGAGLALVAGGLAVAGSVAADEPTPEPAPYEPGPDEEIDVTDGWADLEVPAPTAEDLLIQERFDDCLTENGAPPVDTELADGAEAAEPAAIDIDDAILDVCMPILEDLSTWNFLQGAGEEAPEPEPAPADR